MKRTVFGIFLGIGIMAVSATGALAHAHYDHSTPAAGDAVSVAPSAVTIWYTEELQPTDSWIHVLDSAGSRVDMDDSMIPADDETALMVHLRPSLPQGIYTVSWQNLSQDGDGLTGSFQFGVGMAPPGGGSSTETGDDDDD